MNMQKTTHYSMRGFILLVFIVISCIGYLQYLWFSDAAQAEINRTRRSINLTITRTVYREFQRYDAMIKSLGLQDSIDTAYNADIRPSLERAWRVYGPEGSIAGFVRGLAYVDMRQPDNIYLYDPVADSWNSSDPKRIMELPPFLKEQQEKGFIDLFVPRSGIFQDKPVLYIPNGPDNRYILITVIDTDTFFQNYVQPAVESTFTDYVFTWNPSAPEPPEYSDQDEYEFHPFRSLLGLNEDSVSVWVKIPTFAMFRNEDTPEEFHPVPNSVFRTRFEPRDGGSSAQWNSKEVLVSSSSGSLYGPVERSLAVNWFLGMILLIGVGSGFIFSILRIYSLRNLRNQESEFIASVTHELRTPLTVIQAAADNMQTGIITPERIGEYGLLIRNNTRRLSSMIEEILQYSRLEGRGMPQRVLISVNLHDLLRELQTSLDQAAREKNIKIYWEYSSLPPHALVDPEGLRLILENIITNAVHHAYADKSGGTIRILARTSLPRSLQFSIEDDGRGISRKEQSQIFDPFFRDAKSRERQEPGSGLGLFLSEKAAQAMNGQLTFESPYERINGEKLSGCCFTLIIPFLPNTED